ncbi:MAG TPA: NAD(P)-dependent oxidoreductase [Gemmatimonadaceae bacterium]|nr:NAD(P)-dependent oxidoreductase [Gemmatimonadaceae bacterium]
MSLSPLAPLCLTGASGFIGQRVLERLKTIRAQDVTLLLREPARLTERSTLPSWRLVRVDLAKDAIPQGTIPSGAVILHLAAATGSAPPRLMRRLNVDATKRLLEAATTAGAPHFIFVSSIAAGYPDKRWAPYAASKLAAERVVASGPIPHTIVRPTIIFGPGSPNQQALERLATLAVPLLPGQGDVRVQPIHVDDVADVLIHLVSVEPLQSIVAVGGPTVLSMHDLLGAIRRAHALPPREPVRLPLEPLRRALAIAGGLTASRLPLSAGQFVAFANDSVAPGSGQWRLPAPHTSLEAMLASRRPDA